MRVVADCPGPQLQVLKRPLREDAVAGDTVRSAVPCSALKAGDIVQLREQPPGARKHQFQSKYYLPIRPEHQHPPRIVEVVNPGLNREAESQAALHSFLSAPGADSVELLNSLMVEHASPIVKRVVRNRFASSLDTNPQAQEDVRRDSLAAVIGRVKAVRAAGDGTTIEDFSAYVASVASQIANRFFLAHSPQRTRLRNRLRYILTTDKRFRIRQGEHGAWLCSLDGTRMAAVPTGQLPVLAHRILGAGDEPLELSALTTLAADALGIFDRTDSLADANMSEHSATREDNGMIDGHLTAKEVNKYLRRKLSAEELLALHDHADSCEGCRAMLITAAAGWDRSHLTEEDAVNIAAGLKTGADLGHLEACAECRGMVDDLRQFQEAPRVPNYKWKLVAAAAVLVVLAGLAAWLSRGPVSVRPSRELASREAPLSPEIQKQVNDAIVSGKLPQGPPPFARPGSGTLRGQGDVGTGFVVLNPQAVRVVSDRPVFRWSTLGGASGYEVLVFDAAMNEVARSGKVAGTDWTPEVGLPRGKVLTWQVEATNGGERTVAPAPPEPMAKFAVISLGDARVIESARNSSHLVRAILYARAGLRDEAAKELAASPDSALVRGLRASLGQ